MGVKMFLADDEIIAGFLGTRKNGVKLHAVLSPSMKVIPITEVEDELSYKTPKELHTIVNKILDKDEKAIDTTDKYRYNASGTHRISFDSGIVNVYYSYKKENDEHQ